MRPHRVMSTVQTVRSRMAWSDRQQQILRAMGLRVWAPSGAPASAEPEASAAPEPKPAVWREAQGKPQQEPTHEPTQKHERPLIDNEHAQRIASLGWPALREAVQACLACGLCQSRKQTVFGVGHPQAHWMVVGEAPGEQEDAQGEPFVGAAGQLLDNMLRALSLTRASGDDNGPELPLAQRAFIANALKCRPPRNRNPEPAELQSCEPFLARQIALVQPRIILAMGRFAVQSLLRSSEPIGKLRGRVHLYRGVPLVVTYHPAYLLRNLPEKARAWEDLCLAASTVERASAALQTPTS